MTIHHRPFFWPIVVLLIGELIIFGPSLKKYLPVISLSRITSKTSEARPEITVWVNKHSGLYYCPGSKVYGKTQLGVPMSQGEALRSGYRPAENHTCQ